MVVLSIYDEIFTFVCDILPKGSFTQKYIWVYIFVYHYSGCMLVCSARFLVVARLRL